MEDFLEHDNLDNELVIIQIMHRKSIQKLTVAERTQLASLIKSYVQRPGVLQTHVQWHHQNGSGGTTGPGSGERFLAFHRNYIGSLEDWIKLRNISEQIKKRYVPLPTWNPKTVIPAEFFHAGRQTSDPKIKLLTWLTTKGGTAQSPIWGYKSLNEFKSSDQLGRAIGLGFHGQIHNDIGGDMTTHNSPLDPIFFPWHAFLDDLWSKWESLP